jgi:hypothetical protein
MPVRIPRLAPAALAVLLILAVTVGPAAAARLHVSPGGERTTGASTPGDWSAASCYADLATAAGAAAAGDTILLDRAVHALGGAILLPEAMFNRNLDADTTGCVLALDAAATMSPRSGIGTLRLRGFVLEGDGQDSDVAALVINGSSVGAVELEDLVFRGLRGSDAGSLGGSCVTLLNAAGSAPVAMRRCRFVGNETRGPGGAVWARNGWAIELEDCIFTGNTSLTGTGGAAGRGGALMVTSPTTPTVVSVRRTVFLDNAAAGPGGAVSMDDAGLLMHDSELSGSTSALGLVTSWSAGAGIFMRRNTTHTDSLGLDLRRCVFTGNVGLIDTDPWSGDGGAVLVKGSLGHDYVVHVEDCTFEGNFAAQGAGFYMGRFAYGDVIRCRFLNNTAYLQGGATFKGGALNYNLGETARYVHCEFIGNRAGLTLDGLDSPLMGRGGAFSTRVWPRAEFINCSFQDNTAHGPMHTAAAVHKTQEGISIYAEGMRLVMVNCAFWGDDPQPQIEADPNAFREVTNCAMRPGDYVVTGIEPVGTVELQALPYTGPADLLPFPGSPLIDAGVPLAATIDLAGTATPQGLALDIGAYEAPGAPSAVPAPLSATVLQAHPNPFNPAVTLAFSLPRAAEVSVTIHDVAGRRVACILPPTHLAAGAHELVWRGRDEAGRSVASGAYLAVLRGSGAPAVARLMLLR